MFTRPRYQANHALWPALTAVLLLSFMPSELHAEIRKIIHPDGRIEYTNLPAKSVNPATPIYKFRNGDGVLSFSDQRPASRRYEVLRFDCYACRANSTIDWSTTPLNLNDYRELTATAARRTGLDEAYIRAVIHAESAFRADAISAVGARGLMQLMPQTAADLGVVSSFDPEQNISGGSRYLADLVQRYAGDERLASAAYNAGPAAVTRYNGVPPFAETNTYITRVEILKRRYAQALAN